MMVKDGVWGINGKIILDEMMMAKRGRASW